jgi:signal recognition particle subunit SRP54
MGDVLSLVEDLQDKIDIKKAKKMEQKFRSGVAFNFNDMLDQFEQMAKLGGMTKLLGRLPGMAAVAQMADSDEAQSRLVKTKAMIYSMTKAERLEPELISPSRKARIAKGSGSDISDVNQLLKQFKQMQKTMKKMGKKDNMQAMMRQMQGMMNKGGFPKM